MPSDEYTLLAHGNMLRDPVRIDAYLAALKSAVSRDSIVLEIGTGIGLFAVAAARFGARRVIGVEHDSTVYLARGVVEDNGVADVVELVRGSSHDLRLDTPADVIVSDLRGVLPLHGDNVATIADARSRLAHPGTVLIPQVDRLFVALVSAPEHHALFSAPWSEPIAGIDLSAAAPFALNCWARVRQSKAALLTAAEEWHKMDYARAIQEPVEGSIRSTVTAAGIAHGLLVWFDAQLVEGIGFSNAPNGTDCVYGQAFFPLSLATQVSVGDEVRIQLRATPRFGEYIWDWSVAFTYAERREPLLLSHSTMRSWIKT